MIVILCNKQDNLFDSQNRKRKEGESVGGKNEKNGKQGTQRGERGLG